MHGTGGSTAIDRFNPDNRAWRRFTTMAADRFNLVEWTAQDGRPVMVSLVDLDSEDTVTLAVVDSVENDDPYALLTVTADGAMAAHGPFAGQPAASGHAPRAAAADPTIIATCAAAVHPIDQPAVPDSAWLAIPEQIAVSAHPAPGERPAPSLVLLLDRAHAVSVVVGPFDDRDAADAWRPTPAIGPGVDRLVIGLQPAPVPDPAH